MIILKKFIYKLGSIRVGNRKGIEMVEEKATNRIGNVKYFYEKEVGQ